MENLFSQLMYDSAGELLDLLNEGLNKKEMYSPVATYEEKGITVFICANREKQILCNALDFEGKTPKGFSANWRIHELILHDLELIS